ncbi:MAG: helix-turn-helix domain-containing protein [Paracoccus sp. (in: a-proteobacteria)]
MASHLTFDERRIIANLLQRKVSVAQIGFHTPAEVFGAQLAEINA